MSERAQLVSKLGFDQEFKPSSPSWPRLQASWDGFVPRVGRGFKWPKVRTMAQSLDLEPNSHIFIDNFMSHWEAECELKGILLEPT